MANLEIEARFLEVDVPTIHEKLRLVNAEDQGEKFLEETIFYDKDLTWRGVGKYARLRSIDGVHTFTYKHIKADSIDGAEEIEFAVNSPEAVKDFLDKVGLAPFRTQQKKRHSYLLDNVTVDIDQWPLIPAYVELEGGSEESIKNVAEKLDFNWKDAVFIDARKIIESYGIDVSSFRCFTFEKCE